MQEEHIKANFTKSVHRINPLYNRFYLRWCSRGMGYCISVLWYYSHA